MTKSDVSKPTAHYFMPAHKTNHPIADASSGTNEHPGTKNQSDDDQLSLGLEYGATHYAHKKDGVRDAKESGAGTQNAARAHQARRENGGADPCGECDG